MSLYEMFGDATVGVPIGSTITVSHPIIELFAVHPHPDNALLAFSDWLHIVFRLRRQMLEPGRRLDIGGQLISLLPLKHMANKKKYKVSKSAMDFADKQCYEGMLLQSCQLACRSILICCHYLWPLNNFTTLKCMLAHACTVGTCMPKAYKKTQCNAGALVLADYKTNTKAQDIKERGEVEEVSDVRDVLLKDDEFYGTYLYINFLHRSVTHTTHCIVQRRDTFALSQFECCASQNVM